MAFPLTYTTSLHPTLAATAQLFALLNMLYQTSMAYFNNADDANFYPTSDELDVYPFASQTPPTGDVNLETPGAFADGWSQGGQPYNAVGQSASLWAEASSGEYDCSLLDDWRLTYEFPESMSSVTSYPAPSLGYGQPPFPGHYWPITAPYTQAYGSGIVSRGYPFVNTAATEAPTLVPTSSSSKQHFSFDFEELDAHRSRAAPPDYWRTNDSGLSTDTFYSVSVRVQSSIHDPNGTS